MYPRYNYYLTTEEEGSFVVDTRVVAYGDFGSPYKNETSDSGSGYNTSTPFTEMLLTIASTTTNTTIVKDAKVPINTTGIELPISLRHALPLSSSNSTSEISVIGRSPDGLQTFTTTSSITILPPRHDGGSMARLDRLHASTILISSPLTNSTWTPLIPLGFYTRWDWLSYLLSPSTNPFPPNLASNATTSLAQYAARGYNLVHPVPPGGYDSFDSPTLELLLSECDKLGIYVMYDMRHTYLNTSSIRAQLPRLQSHPSLLLYYTGDEPDGWTDPLNGTRIAYDTIRALDPYHPVSLVLNCYNFYFDAYTAGADIILEDTYPLIQSSTFSPVYNTVCNETYGDCGCDVCHANDPAYPAFAHKPFEDVVVRTDNMYAFQRWSGLPGTKAVWGVPQWFFDAESFWSRWATGREAVAMALLRINHGARGTVGWIFPTSPEIESATTEMGRVFKRADVAGLVARGFGEKVVVTEGEGELDAAAWVGGKEVLVVAVWPKDVLGGKTCFAIPGGDVGVGEVEVLLGEEWVKEGNAVCKEGLEALEYSVLKVETE